MSSPKSESTEIQDDTTKSSDDECAICLESITELARTDPCFHEFDFECIREWLSVNSKCPKCRTNVQRLIHDIQPDSKFKTMHIESTDDDDNGVFDEGELSFFTRVSSNISVLRRATWPPSTMRNVDYSSNVYSSPGHWHIGSYPRNHNLSSNQNQDNRNNNMVGPQFLTSPDFHPIRTSRSF